MTASFFQSISVRLTTFPHAMFTIISLCLLYVSFTHTVPIEPITPKTLEPSLLTTNASSLMLFSAFQCFDPTFPPPALSYPIRYPGCLDAADEILLSRRKNVPLTFSRSENADIQLPWRIHGGNCLMSLDVLNNDDEEVMSIQDANEIATALCRVCVRGYYRYGGTTPVGPRRVVHISVYGTTPVTVGAIRPAASQPSHVVARRVGRQTESRDSPAPEDSLITPVGKSNLSISTTNKAECFSKRDLSPRVHLDLAKSLDCFNAADEILKWGPVYTEMRFGRRADSDFRLPWSARSESCIVAIDTLNNQDFDTLTLFEVHRTTMDQIRDCTIGDNTLYGSRAVGPRNIVYIYVFGLRTPGFDLPAAGHDVA